MTNTTNAPAATPVASPPDRLPTRLLGATDVRVSEIALGCWGLAAQSYGKVESSRFEATVRAAWDAGVTTFDISPFWAASSTTPVQGAAPASLAAVGSGERRLGLALGDDLQKAVIIGRVGQSLVEGRVQAQFDAPAILRDVEQSLARLGRSALDVLLLHNAPRKVIASGYFQKGTGYLLTSGMIKCWGASVGTVEEAEMAIDEGAQVLCLVHNLVHRHDLPELVDRLEEKGVGVLARTPLLYGLLSGDAKTPRFDASTKFAQDDHRSQRWTAESFPRRLEEIERYRFLVEGDVPDLATAALRFVLSSPHVGAALVGARSPEQIVHAAKASRTPPYLPPEHVAKILAL